MQNERDGLDIGADYRDYSKIYGRTWPEVGADLLMTAPNYIARSKIYGRERQDPDAPWTVYTDPDYQKAKMQKEQAPYRVVFLPDKFQRHADKWGNIFGLETAADSKAKKK